MAHHDNELDDAAFYCPRCGDPVSSDPMVEQMERSAGMCLRCVGADAERNARKVRDDARVDPEQLRKPMTI